MILAFFKVFDEQLSGPIGETSTIPFTEHEWGEFSKLLATSLAGQALKVHNRK